MKQHILKSCLAKPIFYLFLVFCLLCFPIEHVGAHQVILLVWVDGDTVYVDSRYHGGEKVKAGNIIVTDPQGHELVKGKTDENGEFSFTGPKKAELKIVLLTGEGHRAEGALSLADIEMPAGEMPPVPGKGASAIKIIIGIGCILGLTGIIAYIRYRKHNNLDHESTKG